MKTTHRFIFRGTVTRIEEVKVAISTRKNEDGTTTSEFESRGWYVSVLQGGQTFSFPLGSDKPEGLSRNTMANIVLEIPDPQL